MRITQNMVTNDLLRSLNKNNSELARVQNHVSTGKSINKPSEGSLNYSVSQRLEELLSKNLQYQNNAENGLFQARFAQSAMEDSLDQLFQLKSLVTQGANDKVLSVDEMNLLANQITGIRQELVDYFNTSAEGRFLFGGTVTNTTPFELNDDGTVTYHGNDDALVARINDNTEVDISVHGNKLQTLPSGETVFDLLNRLEEAFRTGDSPAINQEIPNVDDLISHIAGTASQIGSNINQMEFTAEQFEVGNINIQSEVSRLVDTDYAETLSQLQKMQVAYQAALSVNASIMQTSLLNFLR